MWITLEVQVETGSNSQRTTATCKLIQQRRKRFYFLFFPTVARSFQGVNLNVPRDYSE